MKKTALPAVFFIFSDHPIRVEIQTASEATGGQELESRARDPRR